MKIKVTIPNNSKAIMYVEQQIARINKRLESPITTTWGSPYIIDSCNGYENVMDIFLSTDNPTFGNQIVVGHIDHTFPAGNAVSNFSDDELDLSPFYHCEPECVHCGITRYRTHSFIVQNEGKLELYGSSCIADVAYIDSVLRLSELERQVAEDEDLWNLKRFTRAMWPLKKVVSAAIKMITCFGYTSQNKSDFITPATSALVREFLTDDKWGMGKYGASNELKKLQKVSDTSIMEHIVPCITMMQNFIDDENTFKHTLGVHAQQEYIERSSLGFICYGVSIYLKDLTRDNNQANHVSHFIGTIGDKLETTVKLVKTIDLGSNYNQYKNMMVARSIAQFVTSDGNIINVYTDNSSVFFNNLFNDNDELLIEYNFILTGKISSHSIFETVKQTVIKNPRIKLTKGNI